MKEHTKYFLISMSILLLVQITFAQVSDEKEIQPGKAEIALLARADKDSVVLRWAPTTPGGWVIANKIGYNVERVKLTPDKPFQPEDYVKLNTQPIKPLPLEDWKASVSRDNKFSAIAAQAIYGKVFVPQALDEKNTNALKNAADELMNRYSFALFAADNDAATASAMGLRFVDRNVKAGESFVYRVYVAEQTTSYYYDTAYVMVEVKAAIKIPPPLQLTFESGDGSILLKWKENPINKFSGYYIYRSEDGKSFKKLNEMPLIITTPKEATEEVEPMFRDTSTINYRKYQYKVYGVTPFGELSEPAEIIAFSKDLTAPPAPILDKPKQFSADEVSLSWKLENATEDLVGFIISRSNNPLYNFEVLTPKPLPKNVFNFTDKVSKQEEVYYVVASVDTAGNLSFSLPQMVILIDTVPPSIPTGLTGRIDTNGIVTLKWNLGPEWNLLGYRVLRANDPTHEFQQLTGQVHTDTTYIDTININTLTRYVYYRIVAVNTRYQHSGMSPVLALKRPDKIPPVEAVFENVSVTDSSVYFEWIPSTSEDLHYQKLFKRVQGEGRWRMIDSLSPKVSSYLDKNVEKTLIYEYTIISVDSSGLESPMSYPVVGRPYDTGKRYPVNNFSAKYDEKNKSVVLEWNYAPKLKEKYWFVIYRGLNENQLNELKAVESDSKVYRDKEISAGNIYYYGIAVMTSNGGQSEKVLTSVNIPKK